MSDILNFEDRGTSILFGDGAGGAVLIEHDGKGLPNYQSSLTSLPDPENSIHVPTEENPEAQMTMAGRDVFNLFTTSDSVTI